VRSSCVQVRTGGITQQERSITLLFLRQQGTKPGALCQGKIKDLDMKQREPNMEAGRAVALYPGLNQT
jgi:hypothetical protein